MAKIQLVAQLPGFTHDNTVPYYHSYVLLTADDGSQYYLRGGSSDGTGAGTLFGVYGEYVPGTPDWDAERDDIASRILVEGDHATIAALYRTMVDRAEEINAAGYPYEALANGSNAFAGQMLIAIGVVDPLDPTRVDPTAVPRLGPDGRTLFLTGIFNRVPLPPGDGTHRFEVMLDNYRDWVEYNHIPFVLEQMLTFSEAWLPTLDGYPLLVFQARSDLAGWLSRAYGLPVFVGDNSDNVGLGTIGADVISGLKGNDTLHGGGGDDHLYGGSGNDLLNGGVGADEMIGGTGNDTYRVDNAGDQVTEHAGEGADLVKSSVSFALAADQEIENLTLTGSAAINAAGNWLNNALTGNSANNTLDGGVGADVMAGGAGDDIYIVDNSSDTVAEGAGGGIDTVQSSIGYTLAAEVENLMLTGTAAINGTGNALNNTLAGNTAANMLSGGTGRDGLYGQAGNDRLYGGGASDRLYGGAGNDWLYAGAGADTLDGGSGADMMAGGAGNDSYVVDNANDTVIENAGRGADRVQTTRDSYMLDANVEDLIYQGAADFTGIGNELSNHLYGGVGNDTLMGGTGSDYLRGSAGNDLLIGGPGQDYLIFDSELDPTTNLDTMFDFSAIDDRILLNGKIFAEAGLPGILASGAFFAGAAAHDGDDRIIYDKAAGALMYDRDGNGAEAAAEFARLAPGLSLTNSNISII